jgi:NAD(P)H-hydrate repair Nnr-like enzyme with NAD(P)H-hydrate epimerase domain
MKVPSQSTFAEDRSPGQGDQSVNSKRGEAKVVYKASDVEQTYFTNSRKPETRAFQQVLQLQNHPKPRPNPAAATTAKTTPRRDQQSSTLPQSSAGASNGNGNTRKTGQQQGQNGSSGSRQPSAAGSTTKHIHNTTTFEMTNDEIRANEFDFQKNNNMFEKLPVHSKRPTKVEVKLHLTNEDTTMKVARTVESIKLKGIPSEKHFLTSTGITIPSVGQSTRNSILTLAHSLGFTQSRTAESMGRSIAQVCCPLLGDSFRFSPEREEDRPKVLFCAGPHWQGAATICAARVLASQGVETFVYSPAGEPMPGSVEVEQKLYRLSCQPFSQDLASFNDEEFDLVVLGIGEQLKVEPKLPKYRHFLKKNTKCVLVDPPLLPSYQKVLFGSDADASSSRVHLITANLPLPYASDNGLKVFLVNLGIPRRIYDENNVIYKSPFGDKLVIPIFSAPNSQTQTA